MGRQDKPKVKYLECVEDLHEYLLDEIIALDLDCVSVVTDVDLAKQLLYECICNGFEADLLNIEPDYEDLYIVSLYDGMVSVEPASIDGKYLATLAETYIDKDADNVKCYVDEIKKHTVYECADFEPHWFAIGDEPEEDHIVYTYNNIVVDDDVYAEIAVASDIKDFVNIVKDFFEDYYGGHK